jgi:copper chaperone CopZ
MNKVYKITGMTCQGCADGIQNALSSQHSINYVNVDLESSSLDINTSENVSLNDLNLFIKDLGNYKIINNSFLPNLIEYFTSKKTLFLALLIVVFASLSIQVSTDSFSIKNWMISYMGVFYLIFSFLKLIDVKGFSITFSKYDLISKNIPSFAMIYPFIELFLALAYLSESFLIISYSLTLIFMMSQSIGVFISLQKKEIIRCACMGSSINLDISSLTLIENLIMIFMASYMILNFI